MCVLLTELSSLFKYYFRGTCYHLSDTKIGKGNDLEKNSYCTNLQDPGRLAILPDYGKDMKTVAKKLDINTFYQVGKYNTHNSVGVVNSENI